MRFELGTKGSHAVDRQPRGGGEIRNPKYKGECSQTLTSIQKKKMWEKKKEKQMQNYG